MGWPDTSFEELIGKTIDNVRVDDDQQRITFTCTDGSVYAQYHNQDCCESVLIDDICGDLGDIVGSPILVAHEDSNNQRYSTLDHQSQSDSWTWTFYKIDTIKGGITIRWYGSSNGYYSERVDFVRTEDPVESTDFDEQSQRAH